MDFHLITADVARQSPALSAAGLVPRQPTPGPEWNLVQDYIQDRLPLPPIGQALTVFVEPRLPSGFPDIVAVYWDTATALRWSKARQALQRSDTRVLHYLAKFGSSTEMSLRSRFTADLPATLGRLHEAELIWREGDFWQSRPIMDSFAVRRLVAIEAKVSSWRAGLQQALINTGFASESYLLLPQLPRQGDAVGNAERWGVGLIASSATLDTAATPPRRGPLPRSHVSWWFNEWIWRAARAL